MLEGYCIYPTASPASGRETHGREYLRLLLPWCCQKGHAGKSPPCQRQWAVFTTLEERGLWRELIQVPISLAITAELMGLFLFTCVMLCILSYMLFMVPKSKSVSGMHQWDNAREWYSCNANRSKANTMCPPGYILESSFCWRWCRRWTVRPITLLQHLKEHKNLIWVRS